MKSQWMLIAVSALLALPSCQRTERQQQQTASAPAATAPVKPAPAASAPAAAVEEIGHDAENLYDWGTQGDWTKAESDLTALKSSVTKLESTGQVADLRGARERLGTIENAVKARDSRALIARG